MTHTVRAAGFAAATFAFAAILWSGPLKADQGNAPAQPAMHYLDHGGAGIEVNDLGVNETQPAEAEAPTNVHAVAEHLVAIADAAMPRPRTLPELVPAYADYSTRSREEDCLANAVYFEARGEPIEGQLAVAEVVLNRVASPRYPDTICEVVTQPWQFSFVSRGVIPQANRSAEAWRRAVAVARIALNGASRLLPQDVLWYHADYVAPGWGRRLARNTKIGLHIFYS